MPPHVRWVADLSKYVQIFALLDTLFVIMLVLWEFYWLVPGIALTVGGYVGGKKLNRRLVALYGFFIVIYIGVRIYLVTIYDDQLSVIMGILVLLIEPYILRLVYLLWRAIPTL